MDYPNNPQHMLFLIVLFGILINLTIVDIFLIRQPPTVHPTILSVANSTQQQTTQTPSTTCPTSCLDTISEATRSVELSVLSKIPVKPSLQPTRAKEYFIPFGTGSTDAGDWIDIPGLQVSLDTNNYPMIKHVVFEASIRIPTGNEIAYVRLFNTTEKHPVWFSELATPAGGGNQLLTSQPITLDAGTKTYQIQMKTSLKYPAILDQSRLHITTN